MNEAVFLQACAELGVDRDALGIMIVDHGSRREESNLALLDVVASFKSATSYRLVEPAHMELAEPSIATAFETLVSHGARLVVVHPYFLLPGRHWNQDVPALAREASLKAGVPHLVTAPLGIHPLMPTIIHDRIVHCMQHVAGSVESCDLCEADGKCKQSNA